MMESPCCQCDSRDKVLYAKTIIHKLLKYLPPSCARFRPEAEEMRKVIKEAEDFVE